MKTFHTAVNFEFLFSIFRFSRKRLNSSRIERSIHRQTYLNFKILTVLRLVFWIQIWQKFCKRVSIRHPQANFRPDLIHRTLINILLSQDFGAYFLYKNCCDNKSPMEIRSQKLRLKRIVSGEWLGQVEITCLCANNWLSYVQHLEQQIIVAFVQHVCCIHVLSWCYHLCPLCLSLKKINFQKLLFSVFN